MTRNMQASFGHYIKDLRSGKGLTLIQLASKLNIDTANLSKIENGKREFDVKRLPKLCRLFKLDIKEMEKELLSEKIAKSVYEKKLGTSVLRLAEKKIKYFTN